MESRCPKCGSPVPLVPVDMLVGVVIGLDCCGYVPSVRQALRWVLVERWRIGWDRIAWRADEYRLRHRMPPR